MIMEVVVLNRNVFLKLVLIARILLFGIDCFEVS